LHIFKKNGRFFKMPDAIQTKLGLKNQN